MMGATVFLFLLTFLLYTPFVSSLVQVGLQGGATAGGIIAATATWSCSPGDSPPAFIAKVKEDTDNGKPLTSPPVPVTAVDSDNPLHGHVTLTFNRAGLFHFVALAENMELVAQSPPFGVEPAPQFQQTTTTVGSATGMVNMATPTTVPQIPSPTISSTSSGVRSNDQSTPPKTAVILGSVFGGLIFILFWLLLYLAYLRRRRLRRSAVFQRAMISPNAFPFSPETKIGTAFYPESPQTMRGDPEKSPPIDSPPPRRPLSGTTTSSAWVLPYSYTKVHLPKSARPPPPFRYPNPIIKPKPPADGASVISSDSHLRRFGPPTGRQIELEQMIHDLQLERLELQQSREQDQRSIISSSRYSDEQDMQMASLTTRIESLTQLQSSDWALGRTDDVPPQFFH